MIAKLKISKIAQEKGIRITKLGEISSTRPSTMADYWYSRVESVNLRVLARIACALEVAPGVLIEMADNEALQ